MHILHLQGICVLVGIRNKKWFQEIHLNPLKYILWNIHELQRGYIEVVDILVFPQPSN